MLNFRLPHPEVLVDIYRVKELDFLKEDKGGLSINALTRHRSVSIPKSTCYIVCGRNTNYWTISGSP